MMGSSPVLQWRKFEFFNVVEGADDNQLGSLLKSGSSLTAACSGRDLIYVGDSKGFVHTLSRTLDSPVPSFPAHDAKVAWMWAADAASLLVTMAHPANGCSELKVWAPDRLQADQPLLLRLLRPDPRPPARPGAALPPPSTVTAVAVHPNLNMLALGFTCGAIMLYRGDLGRDRERGSTSRVIVTFSSPVTNLHFHLTMHTYTAHTNARTGKTSSTPSVDVQTTSLFITTTTNVYSMQCTQRDKETTSELDKVGCRSGCSALAAGRNEHHIFVMARDDALYSYSSEGRAGFYAFPGPKGLLFCHRGYAIVVQAQADRNAPSNNKRTLCNVYDLSNQVIALTHPLPGPLVGLVSEWGGLYGVCSSAGGASPSLIQFQEKHLHAKMEILFKKNQYDIAVSLARGQKVSGEGVAEILKQYGDWLYSKGELSMAVKQYIKTLPHLEPSYVIKKFLSSEHMSLLAEYLEALHARNLHSPDHSSLLLNCYTRHKHDDRIRSFIEKHSKQVKAAQQEKERQLRDGSDHHNRSPVAAKHLAPAGLNDEDVSVLVEVCREGGFYEEALQLSALHGLHSLHLDILCNHTKQFTKAIEYIRTLDLSAASEQMVAHGSALTRGAPDETLELLIELATDYTPDNTPLVGEACLDGYLEGRSPQSCPPEKFESVVCGDSLLAIRYIEGVSKRLLQLGHPRPATRLHEMLLAEYLHQLSAATEDVVREAWEQKVRSLVSEDSLYPLDPALACLLCDRHNYPHGKLLIWEHHHMFDEILQHHMGAGNEQALLSVCEAQGGKDPGLWLTALRLLTAPQLPRPPDTRVLQRVLARVDELQLLPPMEVLELVSASGQVTLGQVRAYLTALADREEEAALAHTSQLTDIVAEADAVRDQIIAIQNSGLVFTESNCDACHKELEFPTVHFFCKHSFHQHCFSSYCSSEEECPMCLPRHNDIRDSLRQQASHRATIQSFGESTSGGDSDDVFSELADYLARGLFTDYTANLAIHTSASHTSTARAAARTRTTAAAAALDASHLSGGASESRLRLKEARGQAPPAAQSGASEGRLRHEQASRVLDAASEARVRGVVASSVAMPQPEARVRGTVASSVAMPQPEARVRGAVASSVAMPQPEARVRGAVASSVAMPQPEARVRGTVASSVTMPQPEARLRSHGNIFDKVGSPKKTSPRFGRSPTSLMDQITVSGGVPLAPAKRRPNFADHTHPESISSALANSRPAAVTNAELNPFESASNNPFGDDFETEADDNNPFGGDDEADNKNPFEEPKAASNPFEENDYDDSLNPFEE